MTLDEEIARLGGKVSPTALCVRFEEEQEKTIRKLAEKHGVRAAVIVRLLVARGLRDVS